MTKRGKGTKIMAVADRNGLPVSVCVESATPHEVTLATSTLLQMVVPDPPQNLVGDTVYDSDQLDAQLKFYGIEVIAPHRRTRKNSTQDRRRLKRYRRRWKSKGSLPGCRTFGAWSSDMNGTPTIFSECFTSPQL